MARFLERIGRWLRRVDADPLAQATPLEPTASFTAHPQVDAVAALPGGGWLTVGLPPVMRRWSADGALLGEHDVPRKPIPPLAGKPVRVPTRLALHPSGEWFVLGPTGAAAVARFTLPGFEEVWSAHGLTVKRLSLHGEVVVVEAYTESQALSVASGEPAELPPRESQPEFAPTQPLPDPVRHRVWSADGSTVALVDTRHRVSIWDVATGEFLGWMPARGQAMALSADGSVLAMPDGEDVRLYDLRESNLSSSRGS